MTQKPPPAAFPSPWTAWVHPLTHPTYLLAHLFFGASYALVRSLLGLDGSFQLAPRLALSLVFFIWYFPMVLAAVMSGSSSGRPGFPRWPNPTQDSDELGTNTLVLVVSAGLAFAPAVVICHQRMGSLVWPGSVDHVAARTAWQLGCVFFALMFLSGTLQGELAGIQPSHLGKLFPVAGLDLVPGLLAVLGVVFLPDMAPLLVDWVGAAKAHVLHFFLEIQFWMIASRALGLMVGRHQEELGWFELKPMS